MTASQSKLTDPRYGYDFVVAPTQASINATMKRYLRKLHAPEIVRCYIIDGDGNLQEMDYAELIKNANGSDPFSIEVDVDLKTNQDLKNLSNLNAPTDAYFVCAFKAKIGLPLSLSSLKIPNVVSLGNSIAAVTYNLMCSEFVVVEATYGPKGMTKWLNKSQPANAPWIFSSRVDLRLDETPQSAYSKLPPDVQAAIQNLGGNAFSVQQLLFDLNAAVLESSPEISGVEPNSNLDICLQKYFLGAYFSEIKANGQPLLGFTVKRGASDPSPLKLTDLSLMVNPFVGTNGLTIAQPTVEQQGLSTLNYLCAANTNPLPPAVSFTWNWVDPKDQSDCHGVAAINRNTFRDYLQAQLMRHVRDNCYEVYVEAHNTAVGPRYTWSMTRRAGTPTVSHPEGEKILEVSQTSSKEDGAGAGDIMGAMSLSYRYDLTLTVSGSQIIIEQKQELSLMARVMQTIKRGSIIKKSIKDIYDLVVTAKGELVPQRNQDLSISSDQSENPRRSEFVNFFTQINDLIKYVEDTIKEFASANFESVPISTIQNFVFPGGRTFAFKQADKYFSDHQDLVAFITYIAPEDLD